MIDVLYYIYVKLITTDIIRTINMDASSEAIDTDILVFT